MSNSNAISSGISGDVADGTDPVSLDTYRIHLYFSDGTAYPAPFQEKAGSADAAWEQLKERVPALATNGELPYRSPDGSLVIYRVSSLMRIRVVREALAGNERRGRFRPSDNL